MFTPRDLAHGWRGRGCRPGTGDLDWRWQADFLRSQHRAVRPFVLGAWPDQRAARWATLSARSILITLCSEKAVRSRSTRSRAPIRLVEAGARFIATNPDGTPTSPDGPRPATGSVAALITQATGARPYFVGKPNPMMFRSAMNRNRALSESTAMVGDRIDTDVVAGSEAGLETILVLTALPGRKRWRDFPIGRAAC